MQLIIGENTNKNHICLCKKIDFLKFDNLRRDDQDNIESNNDKNSLFSLHFLYSI